MREDLCILRIYMGKSAVPSLLLKALKCSGDSNSRPCSVQSLDSRLVEPWPARFLPCSR